jgi:hypothetical protein|tara:strand:- start:8785 stop:9618 length:834 start_codon:yes stop_codon:yes gene_type:complete
MERFKSFIINEDSVINILGSTARSFDSQGDAHRAVERDGGKILGSGAYGTAISHPSLGNDKIIKIINNLDECYLKFARYCYDNPHVNLPRFYSKPRKFVPSWAREKTNTKTFMYYVIMERLDELPRDEYLDIVNLSSLIKEYRKNEKSPFRNEEFDRDYKAEITELVNTNPKYLEFARYKALLENGYIPVVGQTIGKDGKPVKSDCGLDFHDGNIMKRGDTFVIIDPFSSYYQNKEAHQAKAHNDNNRGEYKTQYRTLPAGKKHPSRYKGRKATVTS